MEMEGGLMTPGGVLGVEPQQPQELPPPTEAEVANLKALECLMDEFFSAAVSNNRKAEIERLLSEFGQQASCWSDSLGFLNRTSNPYVSMFALTTLESVIRRRWVGMAAGDKAEIRTQLHGFLVKHSGGSGIPAYIRNKVIKLLVDIACTDWPHFYPTFFTDITEWIHGGGQGGAVAGGGTVLIGLTTLLIASEELATPRDNVSSSRKEELKRLLVTQVPQIFASLSAVLESLLSLFQGGATARLAGPGTTTPPPSPGGATGSSEDSNSADGAQPPPPHLSMLHVVAKDMLSRSDHQSIANDEAVEVATVALKCLNHLFTWVPLTTVISPRLLASVFHFAGLGIPCMTASSSSSSLDHSHHQSYSSYTKTQLSILAMSTINEIIYRHCVPLDFHQFILQMFQNTFQLLQLLVQPPVQGGTTANYQLQTLDESYADKFTEFLHSFVKSHLRRFENSHQFPVNDFLSLLFKYTFGQPRCEGFMACLDIWCAFVDFVSGVIDSRSAGADIVKAKYRDALTSLVAQILHKLQFRYNAPALQDMDDQNIDDDEETEWQHYLRASIETIVRVSEILPEEVLRIVDLSWKDTSAIYLQLDKMLVVVEGEGGGDKPANQGGGGAAAGGGQQRCRRRTRLTLPNSDECTQLHFLLRDFASILQLIGRLAILFEGEAFERNLRDSLGIVKQLIEIATFGSRTKLYMAEVQLPVLTNDLVLAHAQSLATLQAWCQWLAQLHKLSLRDNRYDADCKELTSRIMVAVSSVLKDNNDVAPSEQRKLLVHSAVHFLVTLTGSVRPPSIWKLREFTELYADLHTLRLAPDDHRLLVRALTNVLLLPWRGIPDQRWDERQRHLAKVLQELTTTFRTIRNQSAEFAANKAMQEEAKPVIILTFQVIRDLAENVRDEATASKKLCNECIRDYTAIALWLLPIYVNDKQMCEEAFAYFKTILDVLKAQMGAESVEQVIHGVLTLFTKDQLSEAILHEGGGGGGSANAAGVRVVERLLEILQLVVKETDLAFRRFIDTALVLCMDHIYPLVSAKTASDVKAPLFAVLRNVLLHNWRHFFKSSAVRTLMSPKPAGPSASDQVQHEAQFLAIMQAFGTSFLQPDITVFKQNLLALEEIHARWKLYSKPVFTQHLIVHFLTVLVQVLINNAHNLLKDEITTCVHNMAAVDFPSFFDHFLPQLVAGQTQLDDSQKDALKNSFKTDTDLPSFMNNMSRFISDLRYYNICNASLPAGSVRFSL